MKKSGNGTRVETALNITPEAIEASLYLQKKKIRSKAKKIWIHRNLSGNGEHKHLDRISKIQHFRGTTNSKEKPFGLFDLKTGEILMKKDMTAFKASQLNKVVERNGMHWKNIPY